MGLLAFTALAFISCDVGARLMRDGSQRLSRHEIARNTVVMTASPLLFESKSGKSRYTRLFACISEEEDCHTVQVRLSNETKPEDSAWGEEIVDSFETASELVAALAGEFSIVQTCIKIEIRMHNHKHGTRH